MTEVRNMRDPGDLGRGLCIALYLFVVVTTVKGQSITDGGLYSLGNQGEDKCPIGYNPINDTTECEAAAQHLNSFWDDDSGVRDPDSVCNYCYGCSPIHVRLSSNHGDLAYWICKKV